MNNAREKSIWCHPMSWAVVSVCAALFIAAYLLFFYGHLIGGRLGEHVEASLRPMSLMSRLTARSSDEAGDDAFGTRAAPTRVLPPQQRARSSVVRETPPGIVERTFEMTVLAEDLVSPDSLAIHPVTGDIYVSEEDAWAVSVLSGGETRRVIDRDTLIVHAGEAGRRLHAEPLRFPEGIAFSPDGDLYVVEDIPGGRLIRFAMDDNGEYPEGEVIPVPGVWNTYAWEGLDIGLHGEILMAGSDIEHVIRQDMIGVFTGSILYRDREGAWWIPYHRFFASFSDVQFSKSRGQAIYTCEVTGEIGWLDLNSRFTLGGHSDVVARAPEGVGILPDGTFLVAEEVGSILHIDPASDGYERIITGLSSIESVLWDPVHARLVVTEDGTGRVLAFTPDRGFDPLVDRLNYATFYPAFSQQNIPQQCPDYLARILALGGIRFDRLEEQRVTFREFVSRVPLVAANLTAVPMNSDRVIDNPVERVQFVIFEPNRMGRPVNGMTGHAFALFGVRKESGDLITTSSLPVMMLSAEAPDHQFTDHGQGVLTVPTASAVSVSGIGVAAVQFMGMGRTHDFSLVLNPRNPADSYMVVFHSDGTRDHYRLETVGSSVQDDWVIAYTHIQHDAWTRLSYGPNEVAPDKAETMELSWAEDLL